MKKEIDGCLYVSCEEEITSKCDGCITTINSELCHKLDPDRECGVVGRIWKRTSTLLYRPEVTIEELISQQQSIDRILVVMDRTLESSKPKHTPSHLVNRHFVDNLWRWKCGLPEEEPLKVDIDELRKSQMSQEFISLMENRMVMGTLRYGRWQDNQKNNVPLDRVGSMEKRLAKFRETGNTECLVDVANLAMIEFEISSHPNKHFASVDDGEHVKQHKN